MNFISTINHSFLEWAFSFAPAIVEMHDGVIIMILSNNSTIEINTNKLTILFSNDTIVNKPICWSNIRLLNDEKELYTVCKTC